MSYRNEGPFAVTAGEAFEADRLVRHNGSAWMYCDAGQEPMGLVVDPVASAGRATVRSLGGACIEKFTAAKAIGIGDEIFPAADGKVSDAPAGQRIGIALTAATADGGKLSALVLPLGAGAVAKDFQESVSGRLNFVTSEPAAPAEGDRYINLNTGAASVTGQAVVATHVYEWNGTEWTDITPTEGMMLTVEDENIFYYFNGSAWTTSVPFGGLALAAAGVLALGEGANITAGTTTGSKIGTAAAQKLGLWGATPVVQPSHVADPAATAADPDAMTAAAAALTAADPTLDASDIDDQSGGTPSGSHQVVALAGGGADALSDAEALKINANLATIAAEYNSLKDDTEANETAIEAAIDDLGTQKAILDALIADVTSIRTQLVAALDDIQAVNAATDSILAQLATTGLQAAS